jgi:hypothetical protein
MIPAARCSAGIMQNRSRTKAEGYQDVKPSMCACMGKIKTRPAHLWKVKPRKARDRLLPYVAWQQHKAKVSEG